MADPYVQKIRDKYPGAYDDLTDQQLAQKVIARYPEYKDILGKAATGTTVGAKPIDVPPTDLIPWLRQYTQGSRELADREMPTRKYFNAPSLPAALSMLVPGAGLGGAAMRIGAAGASQGGEAAMKGDNPLLQGAEGAAAQALPEALPVLGPMARFGARVAPGAKVAAMDRLTNQLAQMNKQPSPVPTPSESWAKFLPTGTPGTTPSKILAPSGQPAVPGTPAEAAQQIYHPELRGWTAGDIISPIKKATETARTSDPVRLLLRLLGGGGQEAVSQGNQ